MNSPLQAGLRAAATGTANPLNDFLARPMRTFDPDAYHAMNERDNALIRDQVLHGTASKDFIYSFSINNSTVTGVSVVGARQLASEYGGIKSRIMGTVEKRGRLFIFRQFSPMMIETRELPSLEEEGDFYECIVEVSDIKTGNSIEVRKKEYKHEKKRNGDLYERPHYDVIAESKAFRNGVLSVLPQSVVLAFEKKCLDSGNTSKEVTLDQFRENCMKFCAKNGIAIQRDAIFKLTYGEIEGLGAAAGQSIEAFISSAKALGVSAEQDPTALVTGQPKDPSKNAQKSDTNKPADKATTDGAASNASEPTAAEKAAIVAAEGKQSSRQTIE